MIYGFGIVAWVFNLSQHNKRVNFYEIEAYLFYVTSSRTTGPVGTLSPTHPKKNLQKTFWLEVQLDGGAYDLVGDPGFPHPQPNKIKMSTEFSRVQTILRWLFFSPLSFIPQCTVHEPKMFGFMFFKVNFNFKYIVVYHCR